MTRGVRKVVGLPPTAGQPGVPDEQSASSRATSLRLTGMEKTWDERKKRVAQIVDLIHEQEVRGLTGPHAVLCISPQTGGMMCLAPFATALDAAGFVLRERANQLPDEPAPIDYVVVPVVATAGTPTRAPVAV